MNLRIFSIVLGLLGEALIAIIFFALIPEDFLPSNVRVLDFIVVSIVYGLWIYNILKPMINFADRSHKQVAGLGIRWAAVGWYSILALAFVIGNIVVVGIDDVSPMSFGLQAVIQGFLFLLFLGGLLASEFSMKKAAEVNRSEHIAKQGKADIKSAVSSLVAAAEDSTSVPQEIVNRLKEILAETRYITPSGSSEAETADISIRNCCEILRPTFSDYTINKDVVERYIAQLERYIKRRRQLV